MQDILSKSDIKLMVDTFYDKVKVDDLLGPIFHQVIGNNWEPHLLKMYTFWESLLFHNPVYNGTPYPKHADLPIKTLHFERWLLLFNANLDSLFEGPIANDAKKKGDNIAQVFMAKMFTPNSHLPIV
ncbi:MAG: globin [Bacteroidetes bacterium B1(2017)]|nr:MAG: globin [Bacteroidetes bacterium B1(2017)]